MNEADLVLGTDVTRWARPNKQPRAVIVSVRLNHEELRAAEQLAERYGCSLSEVLRMALRFYCGGSPFTMNTAAFTSSVRMSA